MSLLSGYKENVKSVMNGDPAKALQNMAGISKSNSDDLINKKLDKIIELLEKSAK